MSGLNITAARAREIADAIDAYDKQIKALQDGKRETFGEVRAELEALKVDKADIRLEMAALKAAIAKRAKRREDPEAVEEHEEMADSYLDLIERPAPRATPAIAQTVPTYPERVSRPAETGPGAEAGSAVRSGAPVSQITAPGFPPSVQFEGEAGERPEEAASEVVAGSGVPISAQDAEFDALTVPGEALAGADHPAPAADEPIKRLAEANAIAIAAAVQPTAQRAPRPADTDLEIPAFLRRTTAGAHPSFGEQA